MGTPDLAHWLGLLLADPVQELDLVAPGPGELDVPCTPRFGGHDVAVLPPMPKAARKAKRKAKGKQRRRKVKARA